MNMKNVWYLFDEKSRDKLNSSGLNYTPAYIPAMLKRLGVTAKPCSADDIWKLGEGDILLVGADGSEKLPENIGGIILLGSCGGISQCCPDIRGYFEAYDKTIPLFAPISETPLFGKGKIMFRAKVGQNDLPALIKYGSNIYEFTFDVAATVWYSQDGFAKEKSVHDFFIRRTPDARPIPYETDDSYPYNDILLGILEDILVSLGAPVLYRLPPLPDRSVPDFALHVSGDDEATSYEVNITAAKCMHSLGLPYHINLMPNNRNYTVIPEKIPELENFGCDVSLHTDFTAIPYTKEGQKSECDSFYKWFGFKSYTNTNHCLIQGGSTAERLRWLSDCGIVADNSKLGEVEPSNINAFNLCGFGFGTAFPSYTCDDPEHKNELLSTMEIPITYYEPRLAPEDEQVEIYRNREKITDYIDNAAKGGYLTQFFIHPHHLALDIPDRQWTVNALKAAKAHWERKQYKPLLTTTNRFAKFWKDRSESTVWSNSKSTEINCSSPIFVRLPYDRDKVFVNNSLTDVIRKEVGGHTISLVLIDSTHADVQIPD